MSSISAIYSATLKAHEQLMAHITRTSLSMYPLYMECAYETPTSQQRAALSDAEQQSFKAVVDCLIAYFDEVEQSLKAYMTESLTRHFKPAVPMRHLSSPGKISAILVVPSLCLADAACGALTYDVPEDGIGMPSVIASLCQVMKTIKVAENVCTSSQEVNTVLAPHATEIVRLAQKIEDLQPVCQAAIQQCSKMLYYSVGCEFGAPFDVLVATIRAPISAQINEIIQGLNNALDNVYVPLGN